MFPLSGSKSPRKLTQPFGICRAVSGHFGYKCVGGLEVVMNIQKFAQRHVVVQYRERIAFQFLKHGGCFVDRTYRNQADQTVINDLECKNVNAPKGCNLLAL